MFLQQVINSLMIGSLYALTAMGATLIYGTAPQIRRTASLLTVKRPTAATSGMIESVRGLARIGP